MTKCKKCQKEFHPHQPHHRLCNDCWLQEQGKPKPYHPRFKTLDPDTLISRHRRTPTTRAPFLSGRI